MDDLKEHELDVGVGKFCFLEIFVSVAFVAWAFVAGEQVRFIENG